MVTRKIDHEMVARVTRDPRLYVGVNFLTPIQAPAAKLAVAYPDTRCKSCTRNRMLNDYKPLLTAFVELIRQESLKSPNQLTALRTTINQILNTNIDELAVGFTLNKVVQEIKF